MQVPVSTQENANISDKFTENFGKKLKMSADDEIEEEFEQEDEESEEEFSFVCMNQESPIAADDAFYNGQIRPIFPIFDQTLVYGSAEDDGDVNKKTSSSLRPPLRKLFVEERSKQEAEPAGPFCEWSSGKTVREASPDSCKKSNSTGFSKLWRFRELVVRSSSDGKDAFVFLHNDNKNNINNSEKLEKEKSLASSTTQKTSKTGKIKKDRVNGDKKVKVETVSSMYEKHYVKREGDKRKSFSPYRQDLVGFFTSVNGLTKNVHPY